MPRARGAGSRHLVLLLLMVTYAFNSAHRGLIAIVGQPMKVELELTDTQLGLLAGTAFAILYALAGLPIARIAERCNRVTILSLSLAVWSGLTVLCAAAGSFAQLLALRIGIGVGEAGCSAPAHSLISDYYDRSRRTRALSVYSCGLSLGYLFVTMVGGAVITRYGWRTACVAVGLPGVATAAILKRVVAEPVRPAAPAAFTWRMELGELGAVARKLFGRWPSANIVLGVTVSSFSSYGAYVFIPAYFNRVFGLDFATLGVVLGLAGSIPVALGTLGGGWITDCLGARRGRWYALAPAAGLALATPLYVLAFLRGDFVSAAALLAGAGFFQYISLGPTFGIVQNVVEVRQRATAAALLYLCLILLALAGGPPFTGWMIDRLAEAQLGGSFRSSCPYSSSSALCAAALAAASRRALIVTLSLQAWGALHYALGAIGLERQLRETEAAAILVAGQVPAGGNVPP